MDYIDKLSMVQLRSLQVIIIFEGIIYQTSIIVNKTFTIQSIQSGMLKTDNETKPDTNTWT